MPKKRKTITKTGKYSRRILNVWNMTYEVMYELHKTLQDYFGDDFEFFLENWVYIKELDNFFYFKRTRSKEKIDKIWNFIEELKRRMEKNEKQISNQQINKAQRLGKN